MSIFLSALPIMSHLAYSPSPFKFFKTPNLSHRIPSGHFTVTNISLKKRQPLPALAQSNAQATPALAALLEKELGEIHKLLQAMQEQHQKQLELTLAIANAKTTVQQSSVGNPCLLHEGDGEVSGLLGKAFQDSAAIGLDDLQNANSTIEDFCRSYFMFHGMDVNSPQSVFKHLPLFSFIVAYVYKKDNLNELIVNKATTHAMTDPLKPLKHQFERRGLLTERIIEELRGGEEYWFLERKLCAALTNHSEISVEDVLRAIHLKSFDYRVMNLILHQLRGEKVNELHMEFLSIPEFLEEVSDDLHDYEEDVRENNFNILRFFVRIYGPSTAPAMLTKYIDEAEEKCNKLMKSMDPELVVKYQRRCQEVCKEGGLIFGYPLCSWSIPPVIEDEDDFYQKKRKQRNGAAVTEVGSKMLSS